jgi:hypothetical protein
MGLKRKVFISYSLKPCAENQCSAARAGSAPCPAGQCARQQSDTTFLNRLVQALSPAFDVLWDRQVLFAGQNWRERLYPCFGESHAAIILLTESAMESTYVPLESMVLMWRKIINPNFVLVPVYFGQVNENALKREGSSYYGIGLEDTQAVQHKGDDAAAIAEISGALGAIAEPESLQTIVAMHRLAALVEDALEPSMRAAAEKIGITLSEWGTPYPLQLALAVLRRGLSASLNALRLIDVDRQQKRKILTMLAPAWVNLQSAGPVWRYRVVAPKPVLVINGTKPKTADDYVARCSSHSWERADVLHVNSLSGGPGASGLRDAVLRAYWQKNRPLYDETSSGEWNPQLADQVLEDLRVLGRDNVPVYVAFERIAGLDPADLEALQGDMPEITVLYLCNQQPPNGGKFLEMQPAITPEIETDAMNRYRQAGLALLSG